MTKDENSILAQVNADVTKILVAVGKIDVRTETLVDASVDHEGRLRELERNSISRKGMVPWLTVGASYVGVVIAYLHH